MQIDFEKQAIVSDDVIMKKIGEEAVLVHLDSGIYYSLNDTALSIWESLETSSTIQNAFTTLLEIYDIDEQVLKQDMNNLIQDLLEHKIIIVE